MTIFLAVNRHLEAYMLRLFPPAKFIIGGIQVVFGFVISIGVKTTPLGKMNRQFSASA